MNIFVNILKQMFDRLQCRCFSSEDNIHKSSMELKSSFVVGRDEELEALLDYVERGKVSPDFNECKDDDDDDEEKKAEKVERLEQGGRFIIIFFIMPSLRQGLW